MSTRVAGPSLGVRDFYFVASMMDWAREFSHQLITSAAGELVRLAARSFEIDAADRVAPRIDLRADTPPMAIPWEGMIVLRQASVDGNFRQQLLYNAAHEAQHYACIVGRTGTWVDEMLAELFSLAVMRVFAPEYYDDAVQKHRTDAAGLSYAEMRQLPWPLDGVGGRTPSALYARAFVTGEQLQSAVGWTQLKGLAGREGVRRQVRPEDWVACLPSKHAALARRILEL